MLEAKNLTLSRGRIPVVTGLSFTLEPGKALILRGPNGVGKTTLLRCIAGLLEPTDGEISGHEDQVAYAGHSDGIKATLTVRENLTFWARVFGTKDVDAAIDGFSLTPLSQRLASTLSAGQKRRLGLARLMVTGCPIWVLDEPTVSLDRDAVAMFAKVIERHLTQGGSALIATHIDLGLDAEVLELAPFRVKPEQIQRSGDEAFL